jgi:hypothetical protein
MQARAFILALMVLFFTVQPILLCCQMQQAAKQAAETDSCTKSSGCTKEAKSPCNEEDSPCTNTSACNPFASCSQCPYIDISKFNCAAMIGSAAKKQLAPFDEAIAKGHLASCWQPPEMV